MKIAQQPTACDAFHAHTGNGLASGQRARILDFMERRGGTWSIGELADALNMQKSTVSARLNELLHAGELEAKEKRRDRLTSITIRPVGLPAKQRDLFS
jgi:DNA-binding IclR family transcriptional regulator